MHRCSSCATWKSSLGYTSSMSWLVCYCGCSTRSNQLRWLGTTLLFIGGLLAFSMALLELAKCKRACEGDVKDPARRVRLDGVISYECSPQSSSNGALSNIPYT
jgi:hypothetical protein